MKNKKTLIVVVALFLGLLSLSCAAKEHRGLGGLPYESKPVPKIEPARGVKRGAYRPFTRLTKKQRIQQLDDSIDAYKQRIDEIDKRIKDTRKRIRELKRQK